MTIQSAKVQSLQDPFMNALRRQRVPVSIYLTNGIKLQGVVAAFDKYVVLLKNNTKQVVFKHAIATVVPSRNIMYNDDAQMGEVSQGLGQEHTMAGAMEEDPVENY